MQDETNFRTGRPVCTANPGSRPIARLTAAPIYFLHHIYLSLIRKLQAESNLTHQVVFLLDSAPVEAVML